MSIVNLCKKYVIQFIDDHFANENKNISYKEFTEILNLVIGKVEFEMEFTLECNDDIIQTFSHQRDSYSNNILLKKQNVLILTHTIFQTIDEDDLTISMIKNNSTLNITVGEVKKSMQTYTDMDENDINDMLNALDPDDNGCLDDVHILKKLKEINYNVME
jgi:Ca2+-binding EF-hand superfamily protein